jgi:signal transduction histidine kinase/CheY-like chemotaxis protein/ligand-binding sensor domain-containing protein
VVVKTQAGWLAMLLGCCALLGAGKGMAEVRFDRIQMADGLSQSSIQAMAQCNDGFLWIGTQYGLDRFDGYGFRSWRHQPDNPASLSDSVINDLLLSHDGRLWVATRHGLNRFDPSTGQSERFFAELPAPIEWARSQQVYIIDEMPDGRLFLEVGGQMAFWSPDSERIEMIPWAEEIERQPSDQRSAVLDRAGRLWVHNAIGLWRMDEAASSMILVWPSEAPPERPLYHALALTRRGNLAVATDEALILIDPEQEVEVDRFSMSQMGYAGGRLNAVFSDSQGVLWLAKTTRLVRFWPEERRWEVPFDGGRIRTDADTRQRLDWREHPNGDIWMSSQYGLARWQAASGQIQLFGHDARDPQSVPPTTLGSGYTVFIDDEGSVWVGSRLGGLARLSALTARFGHIVDRSAPGEIPFAGLNVIRGIAEQPLNGRELLWLALDHGGVRMLERQDDGGYRWRANFHSQAEPDQRLPSNAVWGVVIDPVSNLVWVLESQHLVAIDPHAEAVVARWPTRAPHVGGRNFSIAMGEDGSSIWVGGSEQILEFVFTPDRRGFEPGWHCHCPRGDRASNLLVTDNDQVLVASQYGLGLIDRRVFGHSRFEAIEAVGEVFGLAPHHRSGWWIGTREGGLGHVELLLEDGQPARFAIEWYGREHGLVDETIYAIIPQPDGQLWMSTNRGLMRWDPGSLDVRHFTPVDGIQALEFSNTVAHVGPSGRHYFGGINGVNTFRPEAVIAPSAPPQLHLEQVRVRGEADPRIDLAGADLLLGHDQNDLEIRFVGIKLADPERLRYAYRLEGLDRDWSPPGRERQVRYAGLRPGQYRFYARAANSDGVWTDDKLLLSFEISPPPWLTGWAYLTYALALLLVVAAAWALHLRRRRQLEALVRLRTTELTEQQDLVRQQAADLTRALEARTLFLANVSHEFRTPLTLIDTCLQRLEGEGADTHVVARGRRYLRQLLRLVDQLLDLSRLRFSPEARRGPPWAMAPVVRYTVEAFRTLAEQRGLMLESDIDSHWSTRCHQADVEKILLNLLTNAIKFSSPGGRVHVRLSGSGSQVQLAVSDSGPGIAPEEQKLIFERFQRAESALRSGVDGAGIGLALVREAALALGGDVILESAPGQGSTFVVKLPAAEGQAAESHPSLVSMESLQLDAALLEPSDETNAPGLSPPADPGPLGTVLVVEDNAELRKHLAEMLGGQWKVLTAADGEAGLRQARRHGPDLIVSDIMMPGMDGFQMLRLLRQDMQTSHIPLLLLTARQDSETRLRGLSLSADDFLSKPFDARELLIRLRRMHNNRERLRRRLAGQAELSAVETDSDLAPRDRSLLESVNQWLDAYCADGALTVERLADAVAVERRTLQRKLKALTGLTPAAYIRQFRMQRAGHLLASSDRSVQEIAISCGFASPQHFSRSFSQHYGMPPDQWRKQRLDPATD